MEAGALFRLSRVLGVVGVVLLFGVRAAAAQPRVRCLCFAESGGYWPRTAPHDEPPSYPWTRTEPPAAPRSGAPNPRYSPMRKSRFRI
jgi:hypothetical protein